MFCSVLSESAECDFTVDMASEIAELPRVMRVSLYGTGHLAFSF